MQTKKQAGELTRRLQSFIARYVELRSKEKARLRKGLDEFLIERNRWAEAQRKTADEFNLLEIMGVESEEVCHSKILAWLLDHRIERGTHAQGKLGFRLFLEELARELSEEQESRLLAYADEPHYWVRTEVAGYEARMDVEIAARGRFLIHVENKIHSVEGDDQTNREWRDLQVRRKELAVPTKSCHAIFLTLDGRNAENPNFRSVGWSRIAKVVDQFAAQAEPPEVRLFARHYAKAIRILSVVTREETEAEDASI
jgi:hypothetical protein